jgi:alpha-methylacyl-CoA racemase
MGILTALIERAGSGEGQVVDCAMCDGVTSLMSAFYDMRADGRWNLRRSSNLLDGAAPFYCTYNVLTGATLPLAR